MKVSELKNVPYYFDLTTRDLTQMPQNMGMEIKSVSVLASGKYADFPDHKNEGQLPVVFATRITSRDNFARCLLYPDWVKAHLIVYYGEFLMSDLAIEITDLESAHIFEIDKYRDNKELKRVLIAASGVKATS